MSGTEIPDEYKSLMAKAIKDYASVNDFLYVLSYQKVEDLVDIANETYNNIEYKDEDGSIKNNCPEEYKSFSAATDEYDALWALVPVATQKQIDKSGGPKDNTWQNYFTQLWYAVSGFNGPEISLPIDPKLEKKEVIIPGIETFDDYNDFINQRIFEDNISISEAKKKYSHLKPKEIEEGI